MIYRTYKYLRDKANNSKGGVCRSGYLKLSVDFWFSFFFNYFFLSPKWTSSDFNIGRAAVYSVKKTESPPVFSLPSLPH